MHSSLPYIHKKSFWEAWALISIIRDEYLFPFCCLLAQNNAQTLQDTKELSQTYRGK